MSKLHHKRHSDFEAFERIELQVVPRYKTSGLSGDEWRTSVRARFFFRGEIVHEVSFSSMKAAMWLLAREWVVAHEPIPVSVIKMEESKCDQPGCPIEASVRYRIKELFSDRGEKLDPEDCSLSSFYRQFCDAHRQRGDCGREDADHNYEEDEPLRPLAVVADDGYQVDPMRETACEKSGLDTGIYVRARSLDGRWKSVDIAVLDRESLLAWLKSRGGDNPWAENVVGVILGHGHLHDPEPVR